VPRDEIVSSLPPPNDKRGGDVDVIDLSQLDSGTDITQIDTGVTSGADATSWDPIDIEDRGRVDTCEGEGSASSSTKGGGPACGVKQ
jgi:hypothetical protein